jgi:hypothetical protein
MSDKLSFRENKGKNKITGPHRTSLDTEEPLDSSAYGPVANANPAKSRIIQGK